MYHVVFINIIINIKYFNIVINHNINVKIYIMINNNQSKV